MLEFFSNTFDKLERENKKDNEKIKQLEETIDILTEKNKSQTSDEQYSRRSCLLLHGDQENEKENTDDVILRTLSEDLDIEIGEKIMLTGRTALVAETGKMVSHELLLSNLPALPFKIRFIPIRKN